MLQASDARVSRRRLLQVGGLGFVGLTLPQLLQVEAAARGAGKSSRPGPKSCLFLNLYGGPSQIDVWDMKPEAPVEYRGEFKPIATTVPGMQLCEHLPKMAALARHFTLLRTLYHANRNHQPAGCYLFTGVDPGSDNAAQLKPRPDDPPALGSLAVRLAPPRSSSVPPFVMMPAKLHDQGSPFRGQTGGWLGSAADPMLINQDPNDPSFRMDAFVQHENLPLERMQERRNLLRSLERDTLLADAAAQAMCAFQQKAFDLITSGKGQSAFKLEAEPAKVRDRYGRNRFGQGVLLGRRLIEAGARMVTVSDCTASGHHEWDTHNSNFKKLKGELLPRLDQAFDALMSDLLERGLLEDTLVFVGGEFGRTPKVGQGGMTAAGASKDGRDHYPMCFTGLLAGGRIKPGMVYGQSDAKASYPSRDPVTMEDFAATLFAGMGLDAEALVYTKENRPMPVTHGKPIRAILT